MGGDGTGRLGDSGGDVDAAGNGNQCVKEDEVWLGGRGVGDSIGSGWRSGRRRTRRRKWRGLGLHVEEPRVQRRMRLGESGREGGRKRKICRGWGIRVGDWVLWARTVGIKKGCAGVRGIFFTVDVFETRW